MKFILYDFEVFKYTWLVVFKEPGKEHIVIVNDYDKLKSFYEENKNNIFVGYNNKHYDDFIFKGILSNLNPYKISEWIIENGKAGWNFPGIDRKYNIISLDLMQDIAGAIGIGLLAISMPFSKHLLEIVGNLLAKRVFPITVAFRNILEDFDFCISLYIARVTISLGANSFLS